MTKNPWLNALAASAYIVAITLVMQEGTKNIPKEDTILAPIAMISLFTFSAAFMAYVFCYTPIMLYFGNKQKQAAKLFIQTVGAFGALTAVAFAMLFAGVFT
jgi:hypothetical protein